MSTKTLRKRIALVAVSAMGFGLLTSVSAHAISAGDIDFVAAATQPGVCSVDNTTSSASAVVTSGSNIALTGTVTGTTYLVVSGNATIVSQDTNWDTVTLTTAYDAANMSAKTITLKAGAVGTAKVSVYATDSSTITDSLSITIVSACGNATFSSGDSYFYAATTTNATDTNVAATNVDDTTSGLPATTVANAAHGWISFLLKDVYSTAMPSGKALVATVKSGNAVVAIEAGEDGAVTTGNSKTAIASSNAAGTGTVKVSQATADTPTVAVVEVTYDGVVVGSRTFTFEGPAKKINVTDVTVGKTGSYGYYRFSIQDAAGNYLRGKSIDNDSLVTDGAIVSSGEGDTAAATGTLGEKSAAATGTNPAKFLCTSKGGNGTVGIKFKDTATLETVTASFKVVCAGALDTWSISMDKASYAPGEIATLTVTGKDADGNLVNSNDSISTVEYSFGGMNFVTAPTTTDTFASDAGAKTYKLSVGTTEGAFVGTFKIAGSTDTAAKTVQYKVASTTATVSSNEVLAAIVKLIASINKQIVALQKLILKKK